jgi:type II secretory pathway pseudopilin PulG
MELMIVIAVMGLLVGTITPRLADVIDLAADVFNRYNIKQTSHYLRAYSAKEGKLPNKLLNIINADVGSASYSLPSVQDASTESPETLPAAFPQRFRPVIHHLSLAEVEELYDMGIMSVVNLNADATDSPYDVMTLQQGSAVLMVGFGASAADLDFLNVPSGGLGEWAAALEGIGNPEWTGRILLAMGEQCSMIEKGMVLHAPQSPLSYFKKDDYTFFEYVTLLPRLKATEARYHGLDQTLVFEAEDGRRLDVLFRADQAWKTDVAGPDGSDVNGEEFSWKLISIGPL